MPQGANRSGPDAIAPGRGPAGDPSNSYGGSLSRHLFRVLALTTAAVLATVAAIVGLLAMLAAGSGTPAQMALDAAVEAFVAAALPHFGSMVAALLAPFPLAGVVAVAVLCAVACRTPDHPHRPAGNRHGNQPG